MFKHHTLHRPVAALPLLLWCTAACDGDIAGADHSLAGLEPSYANGASAPVVAHREKANGVFQVSEFVAPTVVFQSWTAEGNGTHLGRYTQSGSHFADLATGALYGGVFTSVAADGSTVSGIYAGTFAIAADGSIDYSVFVNWTEGTGRLAGVTGSGPVQAQATGGDPGSTFRYQTDARWQLPWKQK